MGSVLLFDGACVGKKILAQPGKSAKGKVGLGLGLGTAQVRTAAGIDSDHLSGLHK